MIRMPGRSFRGPAPQLTPDEMTLRDELVAHVQKLAGEIGERNLAHYPRLAEAAHYIETELTGAGYQVRRDSYEIEGKTCSNLEVELGGVSRDIVLIGAHYDSVFGSPGANDNGSGVAALLALARRFAGTHNSKTVRFVAFVNEEPFYFQSAEMGSFVYAGRCRERRDEISAMISLETIGYFSSQAGSQRYPVPGLGLLYPRTGNFIGFVGNVRFPLSRARCDRRISPAGPNPIRRRGLARDGSGSRLVRPMVILAARLPWHHGHRYRALPLSALSLGQRYAGQVGLRLNDSRRGGNGKSHPTFGERFAVTSFRDHQLYA